MTLDCTETDESYLRKQFRYLPKDFVETHDRLIFAVVAPGIEQDRVRCFLRYRRRDLGLTKLDTAQANNLLAELRPHWLFRSSELDAVVHGVPTDEIARHFLPRECLRELIGHNAFASRVSLALEECWRTAGCAQANDQRKENPAFVPGALLDRMGVTGSFLLGANGDQSDLDLVVYGLDAFNVLRASLATHMVESSGRRTKVAGLRQLSDREWAAAYARRGCDLNFDEYVLHERRKLNKVMFESVKVDFGCVDRMPTAASGTGRKIGKAIVSARVVDDSLAFATPAVLAIEHPIIHHVVAWTPTYTGQVFRDEWLQAGGWLEELPNGKQRLIVGSSREAAGEFIRLMPGRAALTGHQA